MDSNYRSFFETLGLPKLHVHHPINHFDFRRPGRVILVVGPMGSGKTGFAAQVWRDSRVVLKKSDSVRTLTQLQGSEADLRNVFFLRSRLDKRRFAEAPEDVLSYRGGCEKLGAAIADIATSYELEQIVDDHPETGTWILDEASFYDERIAYAIRRLTVERGLVFILPTLILNFRNALFNDTAGLLLDAAQDVFPLTAYCEHPSCLEDSSYTYRYYLRRGVECPALYFDPLIIVGGDQTHDDGLEPNYETRCGAHHVLPGKEYTYLILKPLGERAAAGAPGPLREELMLLHQDPNSSALGQWIYQHHREETERDQLCRNALLVPCLAERALVYLFAERNLISEQALRGLVNDLGLDKIFLAQRLTDNRRPLTFPDAPPGAESAGTGKKEPREKFDTKGISCP
ncbi:thymidine kinase [Alkalispirochaeta americana]|uniref:thymidine kinase n=1 Tax=Alkalispirochaeta americana TaxID=159291 RepID=A0A1N6QUD0_9SPIO|nr:thymidine kinase [Alkalispirochaeta americana]SIQ20185.1 thymidine kinase [Alkalispirochaeta americana]